MYENHGALRDVRVLEFGGYVAGPLLGMLLADILKDYTRTVMLPGETAYDYLRKEMGVLEKRAITDLLSEGVAESGIDLEPQLDVRFRGQSYEIRLPLSINWQDEFANRYLNQYGYAPAGEAIEIVNLRLQARGAVPLPDIQPRPYSGNDPSNAQFDQRELWTGERKAMVPVYLGEQLKPGNQISGSALVVRPDTTIWIGPRDQAEMDAYENLVIRVESSGALQ